METNEIKNILVQRGYNEKRAYFVAGELTNIDAHLVEPLNLWIADETETEIEYQGISLRELMQRNKLKYPAALLSIDWIYKDPEVALSVLKQR